MKTYLSSLLLEEQTYFQFPSSPVHQRRNQKSWRIHISGKSMYSLYCSQFHTEFKQPKCFLMKRSLENVEPESQWMTLTLGFHKSSDTYLFDYIQQLSPHRLQLFLGNLQLMHFPTQKTKGTNFDLAVKLFKVNPGSSFEQTWQYSRNQCHISSFKVINLLVQEKIFTIYWYGIHLASHVTSTVWTIFRSPISQGLEVMNFRWF